MNATRVKPPRPAEDDAPASVPQTTPVAIGYGHPEYQFVQSIMEMQKSLGEINAAITALAKTVESTKAKVDDLVNWKNRILGGAIALGAVCAVIGFGVSKFSDYVTIAAPQAQTKPAAQPAK